MDDDFDYSVPTVRKVREQYLRDGNFVTFCMDLERAIAAYGLKDSDLIWSTCQRKGGQRNQPARYRDSTLLPCAGRGAAT